MNRVLPVHSSIENGRLSIGGCDALELAQRFGTPLYVYDELGLVEECRSFANAIARATGVRIWHMPMTPERVLRALGSRDGGEKP